MRRHRTFRPEATGLEMRLCLSTLTVTRTTTITNDSAALTASPTPVRPATLRQPTPRSAALRQPTPRPATLQTALAERRRLLADRSGALTRRDRAPLARPPQQTQTPGALPNRPTTPPTNQHPGPSGVAEIKHGVYDIVNKALRNALL